VEGHIPIPIKVTHLAIVTPLLLSTAEVVNTERDGRVLLYQLVIEDPTHAVAAATMVGPELQYKARGSSTFSRAVKPGKRLNC